MAEDQTRKFDLPWGTLLPLIAVLAGVIAQYQAAGERHARQFRAKRPIPVIAEQDVDARLWQDPIAVAQKQRILEAEPLEKAVPIATALSRTRSQRSGRAS